MIVRMSLAMALCAALAACASTPAQMASGIQTEAAVGHAIDEAIAANGPPSRRWTLPDGARAYQWQQASITARVAPPTADGAVVGAASQTTCYYTLYTRQDAKGLWKVVSYDQPRPGCGKLAMNR
jgi:hypothetical protein